MPATAAQIVAKVGADLSEFKQGMQQAKDDTEKQKGFFKSAFGDMVGTAGGMLAAAGIQFGIGQIVSTFTGWIDGAREAAQNQAALNAVLKSTHDAVGMSADQINAMVQNLKNMTGVDDDVILQGDNMLLTFTNIGKTVFPEASQAMLDMAVAMNHGSLEGLDLKDTSIQLGKALDDPIKGITALSRVGVTFTDQQKEQIKAMVDAGNTAGAQKLILKELEREFGGAAAAAGNADPFNKFKLAMDDIGKTIGGLLLPPLTALMNFITPLIQNVQAGLVPAFQQLGQWLAPVWQGFQMLGGIWQYQIQPVLHGLSQTLWTGIQPGLASLWGLVQQLIAPFQQLNGPLQQTGGLIKQLSNNTATVIDFLDPLWGWTKQLAGGFNDLAAVLSTHLGQAFKQVSSQFLPMAQQLAGWFQSQLLPAVQSVLPSLQEFADMLINYLVPAVIDVYSDIEQVVLTIDSMLLPIFEALLPIVIKLYGWIEDLAAKALKQLIPWVKQGVDQFKDFASQIAERLQPFISNLVQGIQFFAQVIQTEWVLVWPIVSAVVKLAWDNIKGYIQIAWDFISGIFKIIADLLSGNWSQLWADIKDTVFKIWGDIKNLFGNMWNDIGGIWNALWGQIAKVAGAVWAGVSGGVKTGLNDIIGVLNDFIHVLDSIQIHIPAVGVGPVHTPAFDWNGLGIQPIKPLEAGGPVIAGMPYIVGEKRPELFVPNQSGYVHPSVPTAGETHYHFNGITDDHALQRRLTQINQRTQALAFGGRR